MGFSIAKEFADRGCKVNLVSGPVSLDIQHPNINRTDVATANEMLNACKKYFNKSDICIMSAAVADYCPKHTELQKIKKNNSNLFIELTSTPDILAFLGENKSENQILGGFALETNNEFENAQKKLNNKNLDFIVLNSLKDNGAGFKHKTNKITIIDKHKNILKYNLKTKHEVAVDIVNYIENSFCKNLDI